MGIVCEGYGLRLKWVQYNPHNTADSDPEHCTRGGTDQSGQRASRRSLAFCYNPTTARLSTPELDDTLTAIDEWSPEQSSELKSGSFCVFSLQSSGPQRSDEIGTSVNVAYDMTEATATPELYATPATETVGYADNEDQEALASPPDGGLSETLPPAVQAHPGVAIQGQAPLPRHLDALSMPSKQKRLIHHWITFTSRKIVLIDEPHNPCRTMMLPMALKGLKSESEGSNADVAIFHALCASAAYNLFELSGRSNEQDQVLALYHDNEAVHHLRHNLAHADKHRDQSFAMAIMACIAVEAVSGTTQRWRTHVSGGLAYLEQIQSQGLPEAALSAFRQHMVKMAILCGMSVPDHLKAFLQDESGASDGLELTFPYYGVSRSFLRAHDRINTILANAAMGRTAEQEQEQELDAFELQLYLDFPSPSPQAALPGAMSGKNNSVVHHTSTAFYYAGLVFFQRSARQASVAAVQDLVELGLQELESIDRIGQGTLGCLMLWPALVLGAECDGAERQQRMQSWFHAQRRLGFRNLVVLEDLIATVWRARSNTTANGNDADWRQVIAQAQFDVFRL
ncbi:hypothetical protein E8E13_007182 [Curvularia kusanoi]|uniref:Uncharacterized protein n=1 Tax=Curvularia kusanoi TaxID=90978 RepID=A0A9P4W511_CURKU|nr:hypothetical protein E8E13_007182 [Curvularia kusanoi]